MDRRRSRSRSRHRRDRGRGRRSRSPSPSRRRNRSRSPSPSPRPRPSRRACWYAQHYDPIQAGSIDGTDTTPHDKALTRALESHFDASRDPQIVGDPYMTLFVARLNFATTEETLRDVFSAYGRVQRIRLVRDVVTQQSKGYAFIEFADDRAFRAAYERAHRTEIDGRVVLVDYERSRAMHGWKPRRLGGGLGGRKESGQLRFGGRDRPFKAPPPPRG